MTYVTIKNGVIVEYDDGFGRGYLIRSEREHTEHFVATDAMLKKLIGEDSGKCDINDVFISDKRSKKAAYCRQQWAKLREEYKKHGRLADGVRVCWFDRDKDKLNEAISIFENELKKLGYMLTGNISECIDYRPKTHRVKTTTRKPKKTKKRAR